MYLRYITIRKSGKTHTYWRLVRSVRRGSRVKQEAVAHLGELDGQGRARARQLARRMSGRHEQYDLFEAAPGGEPVTARPKLVPWSTMAAILVIARLCEPSSELHIAEDWYRRTALSDLLGVPVEAVNDDRLYRALDRLLPHKPALEAHLKRRLGELFELDYELLLYDVTITYFEGQANANSLAARGHSRDHRPDCKQVCIGLVVTRQACRWATRCSPATAPA